MDKYLKTANNFRIMDQPIGKGLLYGVGFGVMSGLTGLLRRVVDPSMLPFGSALTLLAASIVIKTKMVSKRIGTEFSELLASAAWIGIIQEVVTMVTNLAQLPFQMLGSREPAPVISVAPLQATIGSVPSNAASSAEKAIGATAPETSFWANVPFIGQLLQTMGVIQAVAETPVEPAAEGGAGLRGLAAGPLLLTSAEHKVASIRL